MILLHCIQRVTGFLLAYKTYLIPFFAPYSPPNKVLVRHSVKYDHAI